MRKGVKNVLVNVLVILGVLVIAFILINRSFMDVEKSVAVCIGNNAVLYTQVGCSHCETQKQIFGENSEFLTIVDCTETPEKCLGISGTPTWIIYGEEYLGVQPIEKLKEVTGCE